MLCTKCGKRPASVHVEQRLNGQKMEEYLCEECAEALWGFGTLNLNKVFSSHFGLGAPGPVQTCPGCGLSLAEFNGTGRLGCSQCYQTFAQQLLPVVNKFHGSRRHIGKVKLNNQLGQLMQDQELANKNYEKLALEKQLNELVQLEKFEEAAAVRDKIRGLEQEINAALAAARQKQQSQQAGKAGEQQ